MGNRVGSTEAKRAGVRRVGAGVPTAPERSGSTPEPNGYQKARAADGGLELDDLPLAQQAAEESRQRFEEARSDFRKRGAVRITANAVAGGAVGAAGGPMALVTAPAGAVIGLGYGLEKTLGEERGKVTVSLDGEVRKARWYLEPGNWQRSPLEARAELVAAGAVGRPIGPHHPGEITDVDKEVQQALAPHADKLVQLEDERRLVADLGQVTGDGERVLHLVTAAHARDLIAAGTPVFAVSGEDVKESVHELKVTAGNWSRTKQQEREVQWLERTLEYELVPLSGPEDLARGVPGGKGLPDGMHGLYRDRRSFTQCIAHERSSDDRTYAPTWSVLEQEKIVRSALEALDPEARRALESEPEFRPIFVPANMRRVGALLGATGALVIYTAAGMTGPVGLIAVGLGGFAGSRLTTLLTRHDFKVPDKERLERKLWELEQSYQREMSGIS